MHRHSAYPTVVFVWLVQPDEQLRVLAEHGQGDDALPEPNRPLRARVVLAHAARHTPIIDAARAKGSSLC